jgi:hypothetical protein
MSAVLAARPIARLEGKKQLLGYLVITDANVIHVSPKHIYPKVLLVGFVPFLVFGASVARRHAQEWEGNPPERSLVIPLGDIAEVKPGQFRLNRKALAIVTSDGKEHVFGTPYKTLQPALGNALSGRSAQIQPL